MTGIETLSLAIIAQDNAQKSAAKAAHKAWKAAVTEAEQLRDISAPLNGDARRAALIAVCDAGTPSHLTSRDTDVYTATLGHFTALAASRAANPNLSLQGSFIASQVVPATAGMTDDQKHDVMTAVICGYRCLVRTGLVSYTGYWHESLSIPALEVWAESLNPEGLREFQLAEVGKRNAYSLALQAIASLEQAKPANFTLNAEFDGGVVVTNTGGIVNCHAAKFAAFESTKLTAEQFAEIQQDPSFTATVASGRLVIETPDSAAIQVEVSA